MVRRNRKMAKLSVKLNDFGIDMINANINNAVGQS